jgi:hypothetical protein
MDQVRNRDGEWVKSIPLPMYGIRKQCRFPGCWKHYFTEAGYRGHYALAHILKLDDKHNVRKEVGPLSHEHPDR